MTLSLILNNALTGLNVNQQAMATLSQNIANANTQGYSRKIVNQAAQVVNGVGSGVRVLDITRRIDQYLMRATQQQSAISGKAAVAKDYADRTQLMLGNPGSANSLNSFTTRFFNRIQSLSQTPDDGTVKAGVTREGDALAKQISQLAQGLQDLRLQADQEIASAVTVINSSLSQVGALNTSIVANRNLGRSTVEEEDSRDKLINQISEYMDIQIFTQSDGSVNIGINGVSLLDDSVYALYYTSAPSTQAFINDSNLSPLTVRRLDQEGNPNGATVTLVTGGKSSEVVSGISSGKLRGLIDQRDKQLPAMLDQLDLMAATLRDEINEIHNTGSAFPGAKSYTGARFMSATDRSSWSGDIRIALLNKNGKPAPSRYSSQPGGMPPLNIDLSTLNGGAGAGVPSLQTIIDEINQYYGLQQNRVEIGNLGNVRLASTVPSIPGSSTQFSFDLDMENLSADDSDLFVTDVTVLDDTGSDITSVITGPPSVSIASSGSFTTSSGSNIVTITTASGHGLEAGEAIFLPDITAAVAPATSINGIPLSEFNDKTFIIGSVTSNSFQITLDSSATSSGAVTATGATLSPSFGHIEPGEAKRSPDNAMSIDLSGAPTSTYYTVRLDVRVRDEEGNVSVAQVSYRVDNDRDNIRNKRYGASAASGSATLYAPSLQAPMARAIMVDANGVELTKINGAYVSDQSGYLKIESLSGDFVLAIDSLDSQELGIPTDVPPKTATDRGFSHYFGLNNLFSDPQTEDSDVERIKGSALKLAMEARILADPSLVATGVLTEVDPPPGEARTYTYERTIGNQAVVHALGELGITNLAFAATGGLGSSSQTLSAYAAQIVSVAAVNASEAKNSAGNEEKLLEGLNQRGLSISGVNLDEELANTVIYQNAYAATARIITTTRELFDQLLNAF